MFLIPSLLAVLPVVFAAFDGSHLFPIPVLSAYTTAPDSTNIGTTSAFRLPLEDASLHITQHTWGKPAVETAPDGTPSYKAFYAKGSYSTSKRPGITGFGFNFAGPVDLTQADQILFSYAVYFPQDFDFVWGGKLPGPYGGTTEEEAKGCAGGRQVARDQCFSLRLMWRENGAGEIYAYLPNDPANNGLLLLNGSETDPTIYGLSVARGAFHFATSAWTVVAQRVQLNTVGQADGELELWVNGQSVIHATNVVLRTQSDGRVRGIEADTFFGGSNSSWASSKDQVSYIAAFSGATVAQGSSPAQGKAAYPLVTVAATATRMNAFTMVTQAMLVFATLLAL